MTYSPKEAFILKRAAAILRQRAEAGARIAPDSEELHQLLDALRCEYCGDDSREIAGAIFLDHNDRLLAAEKIAEGTVGQVALHPREIMRQAISAGAIKVLLWHTHPGGDHSPSDNDINATEGMVKLFAPFDMDICDHYVISARGFQSIRQWLNTANRAAKIAGENAMQQALAESKTVAAAKELATKARARAARESIAEQTRALRAAAPRPMLGGAS